MIDIRRLKELVKLMVENDLSELDLRDQEETVTVKRGVHGVAPMVYAAPTAGAYRPAAVLPTGDNGDGAAAHPETETVSDAGLLAIESPMVGTFYAAGSPDADPFLSVGSGVSSGSVVCIIEAMKVFNEIKSEVDGVVERVLVKNGDAVEFGQKLFMVRPA